MIGGSILAICLSVSCVDDAEVATLAQGHIQAGRVEEALALLRRALAERPDDAALNLEYGKALLANGQPSRAVWPLAKAARATAQASEADLLMAVAQKATGSPHEASRILEALLDREPDNLAALRLKAESDLEARKPEDAIEAVESALDLAPGDLDLLMSQMRILLNLDEGDQAREVMAAIRLRINEIEDLPELQREAVSGRYCAIESMFTHEHGDSLRARKLFAECLEEYPRHPQVVSSASEFYDEIGEAELATDAHRRALAAKPEDLARRVMLSMRLAKLGDPKAAEALLLEVTVAQPAVWPALVDYYVDVEDRQNALLALEHALSTAEGQVPSEWKFLRSDLLVQVGRLDEAERAISEIGEEVYVATARGQLELARGRPEKALALLEQGIRLWPDGTMARYLAAQAAEQLGDFDRAESQYREAYRSDQSYTDAGLQLAELFASRGLKRDAALLASEYARATPEDPRGFEKAFEYAEAARNGAMARAALQAYLNQPSHRSQSTAFAARYLLETNHPKEALGLIQAANLDLSESRNFMVLRAYCDIDIASGQPGRAMERLNELIREAPSRLELHELMAYVLREEGKIDLAREMYADILEQDADRVESLREMGKLEAEAGRIARAIELFDRAAAIETTDSEALFSAASISGSTADRERRLREVLRRDARHGEAAMALAHILLARGDGASHEALDLARRAKRFSPGIASAEMFASIQQLRKSGEPGSPKQPEEGKR